MAGRSGAGLMTLSEGARSFTRYGYADLMREDRQVHGPPPRVSGHAAAAAVGAIRRRRRPTRACSSSAALRAWTSWSRSRAGAAGGRASRATAAGTPMRRSSRNGIGRSTRIWYRAWGRLLYNPRRRSGGVRCGSSARREPRPGVRARAREPHSADRHDGVPAVGGM